MLGTCALEWYGGGLRGIVVTNASVVQRDGYLVYLNVTFKAWTNVSGQPEVSAPITVTAKVLDKNKDGVVVKLASNGKTALYGPMRAGSTIRAQVLRSFIESANLFYRGRLDDKRPIPLASVLSMLTKAVGQPTRM